jgi:hypothetical protein
MTVTLIALLAESAELFRRYEALHRAKKTEESLAKAEVNAEIATRIERALGETGPMTIIGWLVSDSEGDDDFVNNPEALRGRHYRGREPLPLYTR